MADESVLLTEQGCFKHKVSSTLNSSAEFSSKVKLQQVHLFVTKWKRLQAVIITIFLQHMFDESGDLCWNSGPGSPQFIVIDFTKSVQIKLLEIMFQGGFVGQDG